MIKKPNRPVQSVKFGLLFKMILKIKDDWILSGWQHPDFRIFLPKIVTCLNLAGTVNYPLA